MEGRHPTEYEQKLMETLHFKSLKELERFLRLPPLPSLRMRVPDYSDQEQAENEWQEQMYP